MTTTKTPNLFEVDKEGLAKLLERRGKPFAVCELLQNAWDEDGVTTVEVRLQKHRALSEDHYALSVVDDAPEGFADIRHAYTLFAESAKKRRADQRGRFNLGEKLVIAICDWSEIQTTTGFVRFTEKGRESGPTARERGSSFTGSLRLSSEEVQAIERVVQTLLPPEGITTTFNGVPLQPREPITSFETTLRTELADPDGYLKPTRRKTIVRVYEPREGEIPSLYEMGIPVVESGDRFHVDINQKVPLNTDRDNVPPGYLRDVRTAVLNNTLDHLSDEDSKAKWIDDALEDEAVEDEAVKAVVTKRFGEKAVIDDPSDREGTKIAVSQGYTVIPAGALSKGAWSAVKSSKAVLPAGQVTPSPGSQVKSGDIHPMDPAHYPEGVATVVEYAKALARELIHRDIEVLVATKAGLTFGATWERSLPPVLTFNFQRLGYRWFEDGHSERVDDILIHEFAHEKVSDHLSANFYRECTRLGAKLAKLALDKPELLRQYELQGTAEAAVR